MKKSRRFGKSAGSSKAVALAIGLVALTLLLIPYIYLYKNVMKLMGASLHHNSPSRVWHAQSSASEQYLYYFSHSGWSNQLLGIQRAAQLAHSTNRTLILPPILSHKTSNDAGNARPNTSKCGPGHLDYIKFEAEECLKSPDESSHSKFSEIIDMTELSQALNMSFIDLCDFVKKEPALTQRYFFSSEEMKPKQRKIDLSGECTLDQPRSYDAMVEHFESAFWKDAVAIIPSAFILRAKNFQTDRFRRNVLGYTPSTNVLELVHILRDRLSLNYIGVHLRYIDDAEWSDDDEVRFNCSSENKTGVLRMIQHEQLALGLVAKNVTTANNNTPSVFLASSSQEAVRCYKQFLSDAGYSTLSLNDLLVQEKSHKQKLSQLLSAIDVPKSTIYLVLDQILVSLGNRIVLLSAKFGKNSTFHSVIKTRHELEDGQLLEKYLDPKSTAFFEQVTQSVTYEQASGQKEVEIRILKY